VSGCEDDNVVERELYPAGSDETKQSSKTPSKYPVVPTYYSLIQLPPARRNFLHKRPLKISLSNSLMLLVC